MLKKYFTLFSLVGMLLLGGANCISFGGAAAGPMGVYRSTDRGEAWSPSMVYPTAKGAQSISGVKVFRLFEDPNDTNAMYLGTRGQGLYYTYDNADTWSAVPEMAGKFIYALVVDPKDKCNVYVSDGAHVFKTTDCLRTWQIVYTEERPTERVTALAMDYSEKGVIYASILGGDVLKSVDSGRSWKVMRRFGFMLQDIQTDPRDSQRIYLAAYRDGLFRSNDGGESWESLNKGLENFSESKSFYRMELNPAQKDSLYWVSKYGILRSDDAGATWTELRLITAPGGVNIYGFAVGPKNQKEIYFTGTILGEKNTHVRSTFYKSVDGGLSWVTKKLPTNSIPAVIRINPENDKMMFMGFTSLEAVSNPSI